MQSSGISRIDNLPKILKYPKLLPFFSNNSVSPGDSVKNVLCYVCRHYGHTGYTLLIYRDSKTKQIVVMSGDWKGNIIDLTESTSSADDIKRLLDKHLESLVNLMRYIKIEQAQIYFAVNGEDFMLIDIQTAINKFVGPGMVRDLFSNVCTTPEVIKIEPIDDRVIEAIREGSGNYHGDLVIKPSRFRVYENSTNDYTPLFLEVVR